MTLSFSTHINGQLTFFIEKIWASLKQQLPADEYQEQYNAYWEAHREAFNRTWDYTMSGHDDVPKLHSIRKDITGRWQPGQLIHPVIHNRTPDRFQFAPTLLKCISIQQFAVKYNGLQPEVMIDGKVFFAENDLGYAFNKEGMLRFAINDGFNTIAEFFKYFNSEFEGVIIHWTDLRY